MANQGPPLSCSFTTLWNHLHRLVGLVRFTYLPAPVPPPLFFIPVFVLVRVFLFDVIIPYLNLSHHHLSLVSRTMCCLMSHAVSQPLLCATMLPVSQMSLSDYLIFSQLSRLSQLCPVSLDYCVSTETVSFVSMGVFVLISST